MFVFWNLWCWLVIETEVDSEAVVSKGHLLAPLPSSPHQSRLQMGSDRPAPWGCAAQPCSAVSLKQSSTSGYSKAVRLLVFMRVRLLFFVWAVVYVRREAGLWPQRNHSFLSSSSWDSQGRAVGCSTQRVVISLAPMVEHPHASCLFPATDVMFVNAGAPSVTVSSCSEEWKIPTGLLYTCKWQVSA